MELNRNQYEYEYQYQNQRHEDVTDAQRAETGVCSLFVICVV